MWCLASTQSKYDGPNQCNFCNVEISVLSYSSNPVTREKARTHPMADRPCKKPLTQQEEQEDAATTPLFWADGKKTKHAERLRWRSDGRRRTSGTSTTSPRLTSVMSHLTDIDIVVKVRTSWVASIPILKQDHCVHENNIYIYIYIMSRCSCQPSARPRQRCTSNSVTLEDKTAQHIGSCSPTTLGVVEFQLVAAFLVIFIFHVDWQFNMVELSTLGPPVARMATRTVAR